MKVIANALKLPQGEISLMSACTLVGNIDVRDWLLEQQPIDCKLAFEQVLLKATEGFMNFLAVKGPSKSFLRYR